MADTVVYQSDTAATPPADTIVATDDAGAAGQVQIIKLAISTDGSATIIPADAANGLDVDVTRVGGTVAVTQSGTWDEVGINDSGNSITVDGTVAVSGTVAVTDNDGSLTVDGTVTANAGTNLNTSALALEAGGNLAAAATSLGVLDNSVDGNYLNVNLNVAGTDVAANAGVLTAQTLRVTIATDDEVNNLLGTIDADTSSLAGCVGGTEFQVDVVASLPAGTNAIGKLAANSGVDIGDVDILSVPAPLSTTGGGTEATALRVTIATDSTGVLSIDDNGGAITVDGTVTASGVTGSVADDAADSGNPVKIGARARAFDGTDPGSVSEDDRVDLISDLNRRLYVNPVHPMRWTVSENSASAETNNELKAAPGAGLSLYITDIVISTDAAISAQLVEDTGGTPATVAGPYYFAANGGAGLHFVTPIQITANKNLGYTTVGASHCTVEVHGFTAP